MKALEMNEMEELVGGDSCETAGNIAAGLAIAGGIFTIVALATPAGWLAAGVIAASASLDIASAGIGAGYLIAC